MDEFEMNGRGPEETISAINDEVEENEQGRGDFNPEEDTLEDSLLGTREGEEEVDYDDFDLPEGIDVDKNILAIATEQFKALGLNQKQAQGVVDLSH